MSGGSLNYVFCKEPAELFEMTSELENAENDLLIHGYKDIAKDVRRLIEYIYTAENRILVLHKQLARVLKAVEWRQCGDYGDDTYRKVLDGYRAGKEASGNETGL